MRGLLIILGVLVSTTAFSQGPNEGGIVEFPEVEATFSRNDPQALTKYIINNVMYPEKAIDKNITGKVYVQFIVEPDGSVSNIKVLSSPHRLLKKEAKRLVKEMPNWSPGMIGSKRVRTRCRLPIYFRLD